MANSMRIKGITIEIGADTSALQKSFNDAGKAITNAQRQLRELNSALKLDPGNKNLLKDKYATLRTELGKAKTQLQALQQAQRKMDARGVDKNSTAYKNLQTEIDLAKAKVSQLEKETANFGTVGSQKIALVGSKLKSIGSGMVSVGKTMTAAVTAPLIAGATMAVNSYGDVSKQFSLVKQTMGDAKNTAEDFNTLWKTMGDAAKESVYGYQDAADAVLNYARQGFTAKEASEMITGAMQLASGTGTELATVTSGLGNTLKMFGADASEASNYADVLAKAQAQANTTTNDLFEAMSTAGPVFASLGYSMKDLATATDVFGNAGISGSEGANALKTGLERLASPAKSGREAMESLGLATGRTYAVFNQNGSIKDFTTVISNLHNAFSGLTQQQKLSAAAAIFGKEQSAKWMTLIDAAPESVNELRTSLDNVTGAAKSMSDALMSGTGGAIEQLKSTFDVFKVTVGEQLAPAFEPLIKAVTSLMQAFINLDPPTQRMILRAAAVVAAIGPILLGGGKLLIGLGNLMTAIPKITAGFSAVSAIMEGAGAAIAGVAPEVAIVVAVIAGLIAAGVALYKNWDKISAGAKKLGQDLSNTFQGIGNWFKSGLTGMKNNFNLFKTQCHTTVESIRNNLTNFANKLKNLFKFHWELPKIKLPHFKAEGKFSLIPLKIPKISVEWYAKAMQDGMMLNSPTIFGQKGGKLLGAGEAGNETVVGTNSLYKMIKQAVGETQPQPININVYGAEGQNVRELADLVAERIESKINSRKAAFA